MSVYSLQSWTLALVYAMFAQAGFADNRYVERARYDAIILASEKEKLEAAILEARNAGLSDNSIWEACMMRAYQMEDVATLESFISEEHLASKFSPNESRTFNSREEFDSFVDVLRGFVALRNGRNDVAKERFGNAIWTFPGHAGVVADLINTERWSGWLAQIGLDLDKKLSLLNRPEQSCRQLLGSGSAIQILFLNNSDHQSAEALGEFERRSKSSAVNGIASAISFSSDDNDALKNAVGGTGLQLPVILEDVSRPISGEFKQSMFPMVLIVRDTGKIVYAGVPFHPRYENAMRGLKGTPNAQ